MAPQRSLPRLGREAREASELFSLQADVPENSGRLSLKQPKAGWVQVVGVRWRNAEKGKEKTRFEWWAPPLLGLSGCRTAELPHQVQDVSMSYVKENQAGSQDSPELFVVLEFPRWSPLGSSADTEWKRRWKAPPTNTAWPFPGKPALTNSRSSSVLQRGTSAQVSLTPENDADIILYCDICLVPLCPLPGTSKVEKPNEKLRLSKKEHLKNFSI